LALGLNKKLLQWGLERAKNISLKWKLIIPFLFFAFAGTTSLTYIGLNSQQKLIKEEERKGLNYLYQQFLEELNQEKVQAISLAAVIAENPGVQAALAAKDRKALVNVLLHAYVQLKTKYGVSILHFHLPGAKSFLRFHAPGKFGDEMGAYRKTIIDAIDTESPVGGLERGPAGFVIRGVAPIFRYGMVVGSVEVGYAFDEAFLERLHKRWGIDLMLYKANGKESFELMCGTSKGFEKFGIGCYVSPQSIEKPVVLISPKELPERALLLAPVKDYSGKVVALAELNADRSKIRARLQRTRNLMALVGLTAVGISFLLTYIVGLIFVWPIKRIVKEAEDIAAEKRESHIEPGAKDEIGTLTNALNALLDSLKQRRMEIERYARTLERRVRERTSDLVASEEKYRTLVENVPLIVYRVLPDGTTEFINSYLTESLGYTIEEAVRDKKFWREKIWGGIPEGDRESWDACFQEGKERRVERLVKDKAGHLLTFIDYAIPSKEPDGRVKWIDGIMMDISELKRLQERALRMEETRILGEISAHMAHEIRNPLITAGGFARRLRDSLPRDDPKHKLAQIIVEEVARLESFLKILISSIRPFDLSLADFEVNSLLRSCLEKLEGLLESKQIDVVEELDTAATTIQGDEEKLNQAFESLLKHAIVSTPKGERLYVYSARAPDRVIVILKHKLERLSADDLEKFFFPHIENDSEWRIMDLPFSKIIIHRHGGKVDLAQEQGNTLVLRIELPLKARVEPIE